MMATGIVLIALFIVCAIIIGVQKQKTLESMPKWFQWTMTLSITFGIILIVASITVWIWRVMP